MKLATILAVILFGIASAQLVDGRFATLSAEEITAIEEQENLIGTFSMSNMFSGGRDFEGEDLELISARYDSLYPDTLEIAYDSLTSTLTTIGWVLPDSQAVTGGIIRVFTDFGYSMAEVQTVSISGTSYTGPLPDLLLDPLGFFIGLAIQQPLYYEYTPTIYSSSSDNIVLSMIIPSKDSSFTEFPSATTPSFEFLYKAAEDSSYQSVVDYYIIEIDYSDFNAPEIASISPFDGELQMQMWDVSVFSDNQLDRLMLGHQTPYGYSEILGSWIGTGSWYNLQNTFSRGKKFFGYPNLLILEENTQDQFGSDAIGILNSGSGAMASIASYGSRFYNAIGDSFIHIGVSDTNKTASIQFASGVDLSTSNPINSAVYRQSIASWQDTIAVTVSYKAPIFSICCSDGNIWSKNTITADSGFTAPSAEIDTVVIGTDSLRFQGGLFLDKL